MYRYTTECVRATYPPRPICFGCLTIKVLLLLLLGEVEGGGRRQCLRGRTAAAHPRNFSDVFCRQRLSFGFNASSTPSAACYAAGRSASWRCARRTSTSASLRCLTYASLPKWLTLSQPGLFFRSLISGPHLPSGCSPPLLPTLGQCWQFPCSQGRSWQTQELPN